VETVFSGRVAPSQPVPDHEDDAADDPPIIDPRRNMRQREIRLDPTHRHFEKMAASGLVPEELSIDSTHIKAHRSAHQKGGAGASDWHVAWRKNKQNPLSGR
jgi:hypothetical protein